METIDKVFVKFILSILFFLSVFFLIPVLTWIYNQLIPVISVEIMEMLLNFFCLAWIITNSLKFVNALFKEYLTPPVSSLSSTKEIMSLNNYKQEIEINIKKENKKIDKEKDNKVIYI